VANAIGDGREGPPMGPAIVTTVRAAAASRNANSNGGTTNASRDSFGTSNASTHATASQAIARR
jgi:hypothetical protein